MRAEVGTGVVVAIMLIASGCSDATVYEPSNGDSPSTVAEHAFYGGVYLGDASSTPERVGAAIAEYTALAGKKPALVKTFHHLAADLSPSGWSGRVVHEIARTGATNFIALDLDWPGRGSGSLLAAINSGAADALIARTARSIAQLPGAVLLEPGWEMNGNWNYAWQGIANGSNGAPAQYVAAWRRIVDAFRANGATNVRWVFNPNTGNPLAGPSAGPSHWNWYGHYYPGDAYVDFIGAHGYNGAVTWNTSYKNFRSLFDGADADHMLSDMQRRYPDKPIIIGEIAAEESPGQDKGAWIKDAFHQMTVDGRIAGAIWFNMDKEADWRINSSASSLAAYRAAMASANIRERYEDSVLGGVIVAQR